MIRLHALVRRKQGQLVYIYFIYKKMYILLHGLPVQSFIILKQTPSPSNRVTAADVYDIVKQHKNILTQLL